MLESMVLLPLYGNNVCMSNFKAFQFSLCVYVHGASFPEVFNGLVVTSSLVRGSGTLHWIGPSSGSYHKTRHIFGYV